VLASRTSCWTGGNLYPKKNCQPQVPLPALSLYLSRTELCTQAHNMYSCSWRCGGMFWCSCCCDHFEPDLKLSSSCNHIVHTSIHPQTTAGCGDRSSIIVPGGCPAQGDKARDANRRGCVTLVVRATAWSPFDSFRAQTSNHYLRWGFQLHAAHVQHPASTHGHGFPLPRFVTLHPS
jgi:hypothetical protein